MDEQFYMGENKEKSEHENLHIFDKITKYA